MLYKRCYTTHFPLSCQESKRINNPAPRYNTCMPFTVWIRIICAMIHPVIIAPAVIDQRYHLLLFNISRSAAIVFVNPTSNSASPGIKNPLNGVGFKRSCDNCKRLPSGRIIITAPQITELIPTIESSSNKIVFMMRCLGRCVR